jgi:type IV secretory pathway TrbD component
LYSPRLIAGLPREVSAILWGLMAIAIVRYHGFWGRAILLGIGIVLHAVMAAAGRQDPFWFQKLRRALKSKLFYRPR